MAHPEIPAIYAQTFNLQPRKGDLRKFAIVKAAVQCLSEGAMEGGIFDRVGKKLRIRRTLVAYYFKNKDVLLEAAVQYVIATAQQMTIERLSRETTARGRLLAIVHATFDWAEECPEQARVLMLFHYSCGSRKNLRAMNNTIRQAGYQRMLELLGLIGKEESVHLEEARTQELAREIQVALTGFVLDSATTDLTGLRESAIRMTEKMLPIRAPGA